jgi:putative DNA primase/helicase
MSDPGAPKGNRCRFAKASDLAARGWPVFPLFPVANGRCGCTLGAGCDHPGRHPLHPDGVAQATTNKAMISLWAAEAPDANIGVATGARAGLWALRVERENGEELLAGWEKQLGRLPRTPKVRAGNFLYYLFRYPAARIIDPVDSLGGHAVGVCGEGGFVPVQPTSCVSGDGDRWLVSPNHADPAAVPEAWLDVVTGTHPPPEKREIVSGQQPGDVLIAPAAPDRPAPG